MASHAHQAGRRAALRDLGITKIAQDFTRTESVREKLAILVSPWAGPLIHSALPKVQMTGDTSDGALLRRLEAASPAPVRSGPGPAYAFGEPGTIQMPSELRHTVAPEILAHEMGHAKLHPTLLGKLTQNHLRNPLYKAAPVTGFLAGLTDEDTLSTPQASALAVAPTLPTLVSEGGASWNAMKYLREHGASPAQLSKGRKNLAKAFATYAVLPATAALEPLAVRSLRGRAKKKEKKTPSSAASTKTSSSDPYSKTADISTPLQSHQQRVVDRISQDDQPGLVVAHGLGSGKTLSSIAAADELGLPTTVIVPAALRGNYHKELRQHVTGEGPDVTVKSLQGAARSGEAGLEPTGLQILDEAHRIRDPGSKGHQAIRDSEAQKRLLLTASPAFNHPADLASLVNVAAGKPTLPGTPHEFENAFVSHERVNPSLWGRLIHGATPGERARLRNDPRLRKELAKWVDYHENAAGSDDFPERRDATIRVPLSPVQKEVYDTVVGRAPAWIQYKVRSGLPPGKAESPDLNAFMTGARQAQLSPTVFGAPAGPEHATKQRAAFERLQEGIRQNPDHRAVVYSNYLEAGLQPYQKLLEENKVPHALFTGDMAQDEREQAVRDYNEGKLRALLISSAGAEGLDLKGTRQIQVLEPHFNEEKLKQVIGRGIRYKSHAHLPEDQRNVTVERYLSQMPPSFWDKMLHRPSSDMSADEYMQMLAQDKERLNEQLRAMLRAQHENQ